MEAHGFWWTKKINYKINNKEMKGLGKIIF